MRYEQKFDGLPQTCVNAKQMGIECVVVVAGSRDEGPLN